MATKTLHLGNFVMGMRRDGALSQEFVRDENAGKTPYILHSLKTMENYDIDFVTGNIYPRRGYERYSGNVLPTTNDDVKQIFYHTDLSRSREDILVIANERWYRAIEAAESNNELIIDEEVTVDDGYKKPMFAWGNRIFFATDSGWYWTDADRLYEGTFDSGTKYYQAGIDKPDGTLDMVGVASPGQNNPTDDHYIELTRVVSRRIAFQYTPAVRVYLNSLAVYMRRFADSENVGYGAVRIKVYTDNDGEPSDTLVDHGTSAWRDTTSIQYGTFEHRNFYFYNEVELSPGTKYWFVLEGDDAYYDHVAEGWTFHVGIGNYDGASPTYGESMVYDTSGDDFWDTVTEAECAWYISGPSSNRIYEYVCTFYNSTYGIESRPSASVRIEISSETPITWIGGHPTCDDDQVDKVRIYRRALDSGLEITAEDSEITSTYQLLSEIDVLGQMYDMKNDLYLGADLQTQDHYLITEDDDTDQNRREAIIPACACIWKGRIWVVPVNSNTLYFSKKLEEDGATGLTGDTIPDYFPLTNKLEIQEEAAILAIKPLANDQMAIYFRNGPVYVLWGMDDVQNPPSDFSYRPMVYNVGLTSSWGLCDFRGQHVYLSRHGLYSFTGSPRPEYLSENIQSVLDGISDDNLARSVLVARGEELWLLVDENDDGNKETIYILNLQKSLPSWRRYNYGVTITDLFVKALSSSSKDVIAVDNTNYYVMELGTGTTDNGKPIESYIETHQNNVGSAFLHQIELWAEYPEGDVPSYYDFLITDHSGYGKRYQLNPKSSMDNRGRQMGIRLKTYGSFSVRMDQASVKRTDLSRITISYNED